MTEKEAIKGSIEHWKRMIKWVSTQPKEGVPLSSCMLAAIGEHWYGIYCDLCTKHDSSRCRGCSLEKEYGACCDGDSTWLKVTHAITWGVWLKHAKVLLKQLKSLL